MMAVDFEWLWCASCEADDCDCGGGFYDDQSPDGMEPECPCCGDMDRRP